MESKETKPNKAQTTICWDCINAVPSKEKCNGCSWSIEFKPVKGWKAIPTKVAHCASHYKANNQTQEIDSFIVQKCPMFAEG